MTIRIAVPRDGFVYVLGPKRQVTGRIPLRKGDGLVNFTTTTVTVRRGASLLVYGEDGALVSRLYRAP